ncbi:hypothetical protein BU15DRAFT_84289 [Melanogaster broomeanus]|nr:hypothetical protein BU15DRAFT_84289 [Melanogaster broomeanus]
MERAEETTKRVIENENEGCQEAEAMRTKHTDAVRTHLSAAGQIRAPPHYVASGTNAISTRHYTNAAHQMNEPARYVTSSTNTTPARTYADATCQTEAPPRYATIGTNTTSTCIYANAACQTEPPTRYTDASVDALPLPSHANHALQTESPPRRSDVGTDSPTPRDSLQGPSDLARTPSPSHNIHHRANAPSSPPRTPPSPHSVYHHTTAPLSLRRAHACQKRRRARSQAHPASPVGAHRIHQTSSCIPCTRLYSDDARTVERDPSNSSEPSCATSRDSPVKLDWAEDVDSTLFMPSVTGPPRDLSSPAVNTEGLNYGVVGFLVGVPPCTLRSSTPTSLSSLHISFAHYHSNPFNRGFVLEQI